VELFWDLVFVFAVTQVATLLSRHLNWAGFGRSLLILALVWWAWSAFVWAANAQDSDSPTLRLVLLAAAAFIFISGLAVPEAFTTEGLLFATTYAVVRFLHLALYADASRRGNASWSAIAGFALTVVLGMALLVAGGAVSGSARIALWAAAVAIDYAGPAWLTRDRLRGLQRVAVTHFAERYSLFVIICLGESIVAIGLGATSLHTLSVDLVSVVALGLVVTAGMWWTYFDHTAAVAEERLREHRDPVIAAADAYSYLHLVIVAGREPERSGAPRRLRRRRGVPAGPRRLRLADDRLPELREGRFRRRVAAPLRRRGRPKRVGAPGADRRLPSGVVHPRAHSDQASPATAGVTPRHSSDPDLGLAGWPYRAESNCKDRSRAPSKTS
jgi:Bacterial low temperature requirement A protein (LtrA)